MKCHRIWLQIKKQGTKEISDCIITMTWLFSLSSRKNQHGLFLMIDLDSGKHLYLNLRGKGHGLAIIARVSNLLSAYQVYREKQYKEC